MLCVIIESFPNRKDSQLKRCFVYVIQKAVECCFYLRERFHDYVCKQFYYLSRIASCIMYVNNVMSKKVIIFDYERYARPKNLLS